MDDQLDESAEVLEEADLLLELVRTIVRHPDAVQVTENRGSNTTILSLSVAPEDRGHVIGRDRRTMEAITHLFAKAAAIEGRRTIIQLTGKDQRRRPRRDQHERRRPEVEHPS